MDWHFQFLIENWMHTKMTKSYNWRQMKQNDFNSISMQQNTRSTPFQLSSRRSWWNSVFSSLSRHLVRLASQPQSTQSGFPSDMVCSLDCVSGISTSTVCRVGFFAVTTKVDLLTPVVSLQPTRSRLFTGCADRVIDAKIPSTIWQRIR